MSFIFPQDVEALNRIAGAAYQNSKAHGFWEKGPDDIHVIFTKIALIHSEVSEALEELRVRDPKEIYYEQEKPCGVGPELADIAIRVFDLAGALGIDLGKMVAEKHAHNVGRPFKHGKKA